MSEQDPNHGKPPEDVSAAHEGADASGVAANEQAAGQAELSATASAIAEHCPADAAVEDDEAWQHDDAPSKYSARSWDHDQLATLDPSAVRELGIGAGLTVVQEYKAGGETGDSYLIVERPLPEDADEPAASAAEIIRFHQTEAGLATDRTAVSADTVRDLGQGSSPFNKRFLEGRGSEDVYQDGAQPGKPLSVAEQRAVQNLVGNPFASVVQSENDPAYIARGMAEAVQENDRHIAERAEPATADDKNYAMRKAFDALEDEYIAASEKGKDQVSYPLDAAQLQDVNLGKYSQVIVHFGLQQAAQRFDTFSFGVSFSSPRPDNPELTLNRNVILEQTMADTVATEEVTQGRVETQVSHRPLTLEESLAAERPAFTGYDEAYLRSLVAEHFENPSAEPALTPDTRELTAGDLADALQALKAVQTTYLDRG